MNLEDFRNFAQSKINPTGGNHTASMREIITAYMELSPIEQSAFTNLSILPSSTNFFTFDGLQIPFDITISSIENSGFGISFTNCTLRNIFVLEGFGIIKLEKTSAKRILSAHDTTLAFLLTENSTATIEISNATIFDCSIINSSANLIFDTCKFAENTLKGILENNNQDSCVKVHISNPIEWPPNIEISIGLAIERFYLKNIQTKSLKLREFPTQYGKKLKVYIDTLRTDEVSIEEFNRTIELRLTAISTQTISLTKCNINGVKPLYLNLSDCKFIHIDTISVEKSTHIRLPDTITGILLTNLICNNLRISTIEKQTYIQNLKITEGTIKTIFLVSGVYRQFKMIDCEFEKISFIKSEFESDLNISSYLDKIERISAQKSIFHGSIDTENLYINHIHFSDSIITGETRLNDTIFKIVPTFRACTFRSTLDLKGSTFETLNENDIHDLRTIKNLMSQHGNDHEEQKYSSYELDCHHMTIKDSCLSESIAILKLEQGISSRYIHDIAELLSFEAYSFLNDKGRSPFKPIVIYIAQIFFFQYFYFFAFERITTSTLNSNTIESFEKIFGKGSQSLFYSLHNTTGPFSLLKPSSWQLEGNGLFILTIKGLGFIQVLTCTILLYLIVIGIKRKLRTT